jgi:hypothetical protein
MFSTKYLVVSLPIREASPMPLTFLNDLKAKRTKIKERAIKRLQKARYSNALKAYLG